MTVKALLAAMCCLPLASIAHARDVTLEEKRQAACYDDVMRLCSQFVPNVDAVTGCMIGKKSAVSPACAAFYPREAEAAPPKKRR